jgi:hypothetical protein
MKMDDERRMLALRDRRKGRSRLESYDLVYERMTGAGERTIEARR